MAVSVLSISELKLHIMKELRNQTVNINKIALFGSNKDWNITIIISEHKYP
jgi:hypothetical protein